MELANHLSKFFFSCMYGLRGPKELNKVEQDTQIYIYIHTEREGELERHIELMLSGKERVREDDGRHI